MSGKLTTKGHLEAAMIRLRTLVGDLATATTEALEEMAEQNTTIAYDGDTESITFSTGQTSE